METSAQGLETMPPRWSRSFVAPNPDIESELHLLLLSFTNAGQTVFRRI